MDVVKRDLEIVHNKEIDADMRLYVLLDLLHDGEITLKKARELCTDIGVFKDHWMSVDARLVELVDTNK